MLGNLGSNGTSEKPTQGVVSSSSISQGTQLQEVVFDPNSPIAGLHPSVDSPFERRVVASFSPTEHRAAAIVFSIVSRGVQSWPKSCLRFT